MSIHLRKWYKNFVTGRELTKNEKCRDDENNEGSLDDDTDEDAAGVVESFREV